jgi:Cellulase (glycosyl hydrolase family 5)
MKNRIAITVFLVAGLGRAMVHGAEPDRAAPIPPPPQDRSLLPAPREAVVIVQVINGRLNIPLGGWGGQRLIQVKSDPEQFRSYVRAVKERGLNCVRPQFLAPNSANKNDAAWARFDWEAMDRAVAITQEEEVYYLVDYHNWLVNDTIHAHEQEWLQTWGWIVHRYKDYKHLIFEGFNEPQNQCPCIAEHYQKWVNLVRAEGAKQMCVVSPFYGTYFPIKDPGNNWAQCRHHYFTPQNASTAQKARAEAEWQLANLANKNSAAAAVKSFGCGFFMTEGGIDGADTEAARGDRLAGVQRMVEICEQNGYGWCLWPYGDWADGFSTYGAQVKTRTVYPLITGKRH